MTPRTSVARCSAGFDHDVLVWNPHVENIICRLMGHTAALIGVKMSERSPEILSASCDGVIKVWDIRNFKCVQTMYAETNQPLSDFSYFEGDTSGCMVIASKRTLHLFENEPDENPKITDTDVRGERSLARSEARSRSNTRRGPRGPSNTP